MAESSSPEGLGSSGPKRGRYRSKQERLVLTSTWSHKERELTAAMDLVRRSGIVKVLETLLDVPPSPISRLSVFGYLVALTLNGSTLHHKATIVDMVRLLNGFGPGALERLGMRAWRSVGAYDHVHRFHKRLAALLDAAPEVLDADTGELVTCEWAWFQRRLLLAAVPDEVKATMAGNTDLALDGTEMESCGQLVGEPSDIDYDGDASPPDDAEKQKAKNAKRRAKVRSVGPDGRNVYTKDTDARGGYRTGNANHPGGTYVGRELHLGIAVRTVKHTDGVSYVKFGPDVPPVIVTARLVPAGSHRGDPAVGMAAEAKAAGLCRGVIVDRGYTQSAPERFHLPLQRLGVAMFTRLKENQRGEKPGIGPARLIDGHVFCDSLPDDLVEPPMPPLGATWEEKLPYMSRFDQRAAYRYGRLKAPGEDGVTRWKHPVKNGTLRSRRVPASMRKNRRTPLVDLPEDADLSTVTAGAGELPLYQPCLYGTTAWTIAEGKRQLAETANSFFHGAAGALTDIGRGFTRMLDSGRLQLFVTFSLVGYNRHRIHQWLREQRLLDPSHPDALAPIEKQRAPRQNRAKRFSDLGPPAGAGPPARPAA